jgi:integrase
VNPAVGVEVAKREHHESGTLSAEELERLVDAVPDRYRAFVLVAAYSSLRWSALVALRVDRLDLPRNRIRVEERITESGRLIYGAPKTARPRRAVTIPHTITLELAEHLRRYPRGRADSSSPRSTAASFVGRRSTGSSGTPQRSRPASPGSSSASCGTPARHSHSRLARTQSSSRFGWVAPPRGCSSSTVRGGWIAPTANWPALWTLRHSCGTNAARVPADQTKRASDLSSPNGI